MWARRGRGVWVAAALGSAAAACGDDGPAATGDAVTTGSAASTAEAPTTTSGPGTTGETGTEGGPGTTAEDPTGTTPSTSEAGPVCGDEVVDAGEDCDDGNLEDLDGCSNACAAGYIPDPQTMGLGLPAVVPVLRVSLGGQAVEKDVEVTGTIEVFEAHDGTLTDLDAATPTVNTRVGFQGRGNFTWTLPKKGYAFELQDAAGEGFDVAMLGLPAGSDFALYACYTDKTCMRNALVFALGQELGVWHPRTRFVELILDGQYMGLYMLWERVRRDPTRCDVDKVAKTAAEGDLSGGYIFRHEGGGKGPETIDGMVYPRDFSVASGLVYTYHYPDSDKITGEQSAYLQGFVQDFEDSMQADPAGHAAWIDVGTWVDHAIVEELTNNWDGYVHSVYMTKEADEDGGLLGMGPLWDFDLAFANGNVTGYNCATDSWAVGNVRPAPDNMPPYWLALFADPEFLRSFKCRWQALRGGAISEATFAGRIATWEAFTAAARVRDQAVWNTIGVSIFPNCFSGATYEEEVSMLMAWISARIAWLDGQVAMMPGSCG